MVYLGKEKLHFDIFFLHRFYQLHMNVRGIMLCTRAM